MNHKIFVPPRASKQEPVAYLTYEGETFEIEYTLMHWLAGWVRAGARQSGVGIGIVQNTTAVFDHIASAMCWDANPPPEDEHTKLLRRCGHKIARPVFTLPNPNLTVSDG